jgi:hypothetical protein
MKNLIKFLGIIAFVTLIGFLMVACDNGSNNNRDNNKDDAISVIVSVKDHRHSRWLEEAP